MRGHRCSDTDGLGLFQTNWYMRYTDGKFACIKEIVDYLGDEVSQCLPHIHAMTGCDQTSAFYRRGKVKVMKRVMENPELLDLIRNIGVERSLTQETISDGIEFVRRVIYKGRAKEDYITTRLRLYKASKSKSTANIPPDPDSLLQALKRVHAILYVWIRSDECHIDLLPYRDFGWEWCEDQKVVAPVWFIGPQLPPTIKKKSKSQKSESSNPEDADDESENEGGKLSKRKKKSNKTKNTKKRKVNQEEPPPCEREAEPFESKEDDSEQLDSEDIDSEKFESEDSSDERLESGTNDQEQSEKDDGDSSGDLESEDADDETTATEDMKSDESDWELSDFKSSSESDDEWKP